jgi:hypothetical protein
MRFRGRAYVTRVPAVHFACSILALFLVIFAVWPPPTEEDMVPLGDGALTYSYTLVIFVIAFLLLFSRHVLNRSNGFLFAPLLLALIGCVALMTGRAVSPQVTTYSSALIPLMLCALPIMISPTDIWLDCPTICRFMLFVLCLASFGHLAWQFSHLLGVPVFPSLEQTFTFCFAMLLTGFAGRKRLLAAITLGAVASLALRPTSTLFISTAFSLGAILVYRLRARRFLRFAMTLTIAIILLANLGILASADFAELIYSAEPHIKQTVLAAQTNNDFRLGVIDALRSESVSNSLLFGKYFSGDINPTVTGVLPWWYDVGQTDDAPIHSDFLIMLSQGGCVGYSVFAILLLGFARLCVKGARLSASVGQTALERFFDASLAMEVVFCLYIMFNPIMQKPYIVSFFFVLIPIGVLLMRGLEHAFVVVRPTRPPVTLSYGALPGP